MTGPADAGPPHPEATAPAPAARVGAGWILALTLGVVAVFATWFGPLQILLPAQADRIAAGAGRETLLALVTGVGAAVALVANPVWGLVSDRCRARLGTRMPVVYAGSLLGAAGHVVLFTADSPAVTVAGWALVQLGFNGPFAVLAALIADRAPEEQRGLVGSLFGVGQIVGVISGTLVAESVGGAPLGYLVLAVGTPALLGAIVLAQHGHDRRAVDRPRSAASASSSSPSPDPAGAPGLAGFRPTRDYVWAWLLRFLMNLANAVLLLYLYFFLDAVIGSDDPGGGVLLVTVITLLLSAVCAGLAGALSDKVGRRRAFAIAGAVGTAAGFAVLATSTSMAQTLVAAAVLGVGWGLFVAVDMAIITSTLASDGTAGTMLGVANIASSLPQVVAPAIAAPLVTSAAGYPALYGVGAGIAVAAALCVLPLRTVR